MFMVTPLISFIILDKKIGSNELPNELRIDAVERDKVRRKG